MGAAFGWGFLAASSLLIGGVVALTVPVSLRTLGLVMGFGSGVLISAVAYELVAEAFQTADGQAAVALGLFAGCGTFFIGDSLIDRFGGADRKSAAGARQAARPLRSCSGSSSTACPSRP